MRSTESTSGPTSSYEFGRATPPVTTIFTWGRTASSLAMLIALVTTVSAIPPPAGSGRTASSLATSEVVVPPLIPTVEPEGISSAAAFAMRCFSSALRAAL